MGFLEIRMSKVWLKSQHSRSLHHWIPQSPQCSRRLRNHRCCLRSAQPTFYTVQFTPPLRISGSREFRAEWNCFSMRHLRPARMSRNPVNRLVLISDIRIFRKCASRIPRPMSIPNPGIQNGMEYNYSYPVIYFTDSVGNLSKWVPNGPVSCLALIRNSPRDIHKMETLSFPPHSTTL